MAGHQVAIFSDKPKERHDAVFKIIVEYLLGASDEGLSWAPNEDKDLEVLADDYFFGRTQLPLKICHQHDLERVFSSNALDIQSHRNKNSKKIALSTAETECIGLSTDLSKTMPIVYLLREISPVMDAPTCDKIIKCTVFKGNNNDIELAKAPKIIPRTKHVNVKLCHFRSCMKKGEIIIEKCDTAEQEAGFLAKPLALQLFCWLR